MTAAELLGDKSPEVALRLPCPTCGARFVYRNWNGSPACSAAPHYRPNTVVRVAVMGMQYTREQIVATLREAYGKYADHMQAGHDMAEAGEELSHAVCRIVDPPICSMPRDEVLEARLAMYNTAEVDFSNDPPEPPPTDDEYGYREYR